MLRGRDRASYWLMPQLNRHRALRAGDPGSVPRMLLLTMQASMQVGCEEVGLMDGIRSSPLCDAGRQAWGEAQNFRGADPICFQTFVRPPDFPAFSPAAATLALQP